jgi:hypothetical protein
MSNKIGLWLDHRQAIIVRFFDYGDDIIRLVSDLPKHIRFSGVSYDRTELNPHNDFAEDKRDKRFKQLLNHYYDDVILSLASADSILILGPGEAKLELQKRLTKSEFVSAEITVETADKMTERQVAARVRQYFQEHELETNSATS